MLIKMNFCLPVALISSLTGLFPEVDFKLVESLRAGPLSDVVETRLSTKFLYILYLKQLIKNVMYFELILTHIYFQKRLG